MEESQDIKLTPHEPISTRRQFLLNTARLLGTAAVGLSILSRSEPSPVTVHPQKAPEPSPLPPDREITADGTLKLEGVECYGTEKPLSREELQKLFEKLNTRETEMRDDTYYSSIFINKSTFDSYPKLNKFEGFISGMTRHTRTLNELIAKQNDGKEDSPKIALRRIIICDDDTEMPEEHLYEMPLHDTDGGWVYKKPYHLEESSAYVQGTNEDMAVLHEWGHTVLHLPDLYTLTFPFQENTSDATATLPAQWRGYNVMTRNDRNNNLMLNHNSPTLALGEHSLLQIKRRKKAGKTHDPINRKIEERHDHFPGETPKQVALVFGKDYQGCEITFFTSSKTANDTLTLDERVKTKLGSDGNIAFAMKNVFPIEKDGMVSNNDGMVLIKVTKDSGEEYCRWIDICDFNIASWKGYQDKATMHMKLASSQDHPETFDWTITTGK